MKYVLFSLIPVLFLLALLEIGVRSYDYLTLGGYNSRIKRLVELKDAGPYYKKGSLIANELGFSGRGPFDPRKEKGEFRILTLGGSGCAGTADSNWPDIMARELNMNPAITRPIRVVNGGIGGHTSSGEKKFLTRWIRLKPDLIIIYDGWNDMYFSRYLPDEYREQFDISNRYYYQPIGRKVEEFFLRHLAFVRKVKVLSKEIKNIKKKKSNKGKIDGTGLVTSISLNETDDKGSDIVYVEGEPFEMKLSWRRGERITIIDPTEKIPDNMSFIYKTNLEEMAHLARKHGVPVILVQQPDLLYRYTNHPEFFMEDEMEKVLGMHKGIREDWIRTTTALYPRITQIMSEIYMAFDNVIGFYTIDNIFDEYPEKLKFWSADSCHQTEEGREVIGKHLAKLIYKDVLRGGR